MTIILNNGSQPEGLGIKSYGGDQFISANMGIQPWSVSLGEMTVSTNEFLSAVERSLINSTIVEGDPRIIFVTRMCALQEVEGYPSKPSTDQKRFAHVEEQPMYDYEQESPLVANLGTYQLSLLDLLVAAEYIVNNSNIIPEMNDSRPTFLEVMRSLVLVDEPDGGKRFVLPDGQVSFSDITQPDPSFGRAPVIHWLADPYSNSESLEPEQPYDRYTREMERLCQQAGYVVTISRINKRVLIEASSRAIGNHELRNELHGCRLDLEKYGFIVECLEE